MHPQLAISINKDVIQSCYCVFLSNKHKRNNIDVIHDTQLSYGQKPAQHEVIYSIAIYNKTSYLMEICLSWPLSAPVVTDFSWLVSSQ